MELNQGKVIMSRASRAEVIPSEILVFKNSQGFLISGMAHEYMRW